MGAAVSTDTTAKAAEPEVLVQRRGRLGHLILNRPAALNALTDTMVDLLTEALEAWRDDDGVDTVLLTGAGDRALCAGGDIVAIHADAVTGGDATERFWAREYRLNALIAEYPKPYVAVMDGIVLGGGVGVSAHGSHRVVTERTRLGMPETGIGFVPDVGGTHLLANAPGELGTHIALTAGHVGAADAILLGLADYYLDSSRIESLVENLAAEDAGVVLSALAQDPPPAPLAEAREWIDDAYGRESVEDIVRALDESLTEPARKASVAMSANSPTALKVTLESLRRARRLSGLREVLDQEYRVSLRSFEGPDFVEGIRAQVIDKDRNPRWSPSTLEEVGAVAVDRHFADLGPRELGLSTLRTGAGR